MQHLYMYKYDHRDRSESHLGSLSRIPLCAKDVVNLESVTHGCSSLGIVVQIKMFLIHLGHPEISSAFISGHPRKCIKP